MWLCHCSTGSTELPTDTRRLGPAGGRIAIRPLGRPQRSSPHRRSPPVRKRSLRPVVAEWRGSRAEARSPNREAARSPPPPTDRSSRRPLRTSRSARPADTSRHLGRYLRWTGMGTRSVRAPEGTGWYRGSLASTAPHCRQRCRRKTGSTTQCRTRIGAGSASMRYRRREASEGKRGFMAHRQAAPPRHR